MTERLPEIGENERALAVRAEDAANNLPAVLTSQTEFETAGETLRQLQTLGKSIEDKRVELTAPVLEAKRRLDDFFRGPAERVKAAITAVKTLMLGYTREQEAIRQAEEARLRKIEEAKAAKERARLEAIAAAEREKADKLRREAEAKAAAERARLQAEADALKSKRDAASRVARAELEARAKAVEADTTKADAMAAKSAGHERQAEVTTAVDVRVESKVQPVAGIRQQVVWKFRVVDFKLLPDDFKVVNGILLGVVARSDKEKAVVPGVEFYSESVLAARGA
jgi:hypothetical protein